jgi:hypothetical protein
MFGGCLPVESTTDDFFFKTFRQLNGQREGNAKNKNRSYKGCNASQSGNHIKTEIRGRTAPKRLLAPSLLGGKEVCVESLDISET